MNTFSYNLMESVVIPSAWIPIMYLQQQDITIVMSSKPKMYDQQHYDTLFGEFNICTHDHHTTKPTQPIPKNEWKKINKKNKRKPKHLLCMAAALNWCNIINVAWTLKTNNLCLEYQSLQLLSMWTSLSSLSIPNYKWVFYVMLMNCMREYILENNVTLVYPCLDMYTARKTENNIDSGFYHLNRSLQYFSQD